MYKRNQLFFLVALRILIGWHFLYEGLLKLFSPGWTSKGYLLSSEGIFASFFKWLGSDAMIGISDYGTILALVFVGLTLTLGIFEKAGAIVGMAILAMFYLSHPSWPGLEASGPTEGNYLNVNKNLIELAALGVLAFFTTGHKAGLKMFLKKNGE